MSVRRDKRPWLALGARVTINRICSHSVHLGERLVETPLTIREYVL